MTYNSFLTPSIPKISPYYLSNTNEYQIFRMHWINSSRRSPSLVKRSFVLEHLLTQFCAMPAGIGNVGMQLTTSQLLQESWSGRFPSFRFLRAIIRSVSRPACNRDTPNADSNQFGVEQCVQPSQARECNAPS